MNGQKPNPPTPSGRAGLRPDMFQYEVAQEIGIDLSRIDPNRARQYEQRFHGRGGGRQERR